MLSVSKFVSLNETVCSAGNTFHANREIKFSKQPSLRTGQECQEMRCEKNMATKCFLLAAHPIFSLTVLLTQEAHRLLVVAGKAIDSFLVAFILRESSQLGHN